MIFQVNHKMTDFLKSNSEVTKESFTSAVRKSGQSLFLREQVKVIRSTVYVEVASEKFLIYSFTHNTFAILNVASENKEIAACRLEGVEAESIEDIAFSDPPTHFFFVDKDGKMNARPFRVVMNES
jgi:hypothetical protein